MDYGIPAGVYKFSYALSVAAVRQEAERVVDILRERQLRYPVFLDLEYSN